MGYVLSETFWHICCQWMEKLPGWQQERYGVRVHLKIYIIQTEVPKKYFSVSKMQKYLFSFLRFRWKHFVWIEQERLFFVTWKYNYLGLGSLILLPSHKKNPILDPGLNCVAGTLGGQARIQDFGQGGASRVLTSRGPESKIFSKFSLKICLKTAWF